ncbi:LytR/AlgR family response regulator transcription factor [Litorimonas sp. RW-G-Af-16]|uniref:LytR/AlgR family response regulator transcription factor n=1 Tax=Litorimonas sp. RW-G-Af-16 TaxID=3241168 RepID=UPI00390CA609
MNFKVVIVDDEPLALNLLSAILADIDDLEIVAECRNGREAVDAVLMHQPDILFLDIQMPEMNGFDVIAAIQNDIMPKVIFTTAYAEFAIDAFKVQAIDYVLKPLEDQAIIESVARARSVLEAGLPYRTKPELLTALHDISQRVGDSHKAPSNAVATKNSALIVKDTDRISFLDKDRIEWLEAAGDYVCIHIEGTTRLIRSTLKAVEKELGGAQFKRIHRSTILNISYIKDIVPALKGEAHAIMRDGSQLKVSRRYGGEIRDLFRKN